MLRVRDSPEKLREHHARVEALAHLVTASPALDDVYQATIVLELALQQKSGPVVVPIDTAHHQAVFPALTDGKEQSQSGLGFSCGVRAAFGQARRCPLSSAGDKWARSVDVRGQVSAIGLAYAVGGVDAAQILRWEGADPSHEVSTYCCPPNTDEFHLLGPHITPDFWWNIQQGIFRGPPLHVAVLRHRAAMVRAHLDQESAEEVTRQLPALLDLALAVKAPQVVEVLLDTWVQRCAANPPREVAAAALIAACRLDRADLVAQVCSTLTQLGVPLKGLSEPLYAGRGRMYGTNFGCTPLQFALAAGASGARSTAQALLDAGAADETQVTGCVLHACEQGDLHTLRWLSEQRPRHRQRARWVGWGMGARGQSPLHVAAQFGRITVMEYLLEGMDVDLVGASGWRRKTPLHVAAVAGHVEAVRLLLRRGAEVEARTEGGYTPLHIAAKSGHAEVVGLLIKCGTQVDARSRHCGTALHLAARMGQLDAIRVLLEGGADVKAVDSTGKNAMHVAVSSSKMVIETNRAAIVKLLAAADASLVEARNPRGQTPLQVAICRYRHLETAKALLQLGASPAVTDAYGKNVLHYYCGITKHHRAAGIRDLLEYCGDDVINARDDALQTPLHLAVQPALLVRGPAYLLAARGAALDATDNSGRTPLDIARDQFRGGVFVSKLEAAGRKRAAEQLREAGADDTQGRAKRARRRSPRLAAS